MQSPPRSGWELWGRWSCPIHPGSPPPHARLHPAPRCFRANPTGSSGAVRAANPMWNLGCVPKAWPTPRSHPSGPELDIHPTSTAPSTSQNPAGGEEGGRTQHPETPWNIWGYLWQRAGLVPRWAGPFSPAGWEHPSIQGSRLQTPRLQPKPLHHPPAHLPQPGRDQCITYLHPSRSLSRSHPVIHCSRCLRTWPRFQCIPGPRTVP